MPEHGLQCCKYLTCDVINIYMCLQSTFLTQAITKKLILKSKVARKDNSNSLLWNMKILQITPLCQLFSTPPLQGSMKSAFTTFLQLRYCNYVMGPVGYTKPNQATAIATSTLYLHYSYINVVLTYPYPFHSPNVESLNYVNVGKKTKKKTQ